MNDTAFTTSPMIDTYRWGRVTFEEATELRQAEEAKAKAKVARTGKPVTIRINTGMYEVFTTNGHFMIEKERDRMTEEETGWWVVLEYIDGWACEIGICFQTLRDAKAHAITI